MTVRMRLAGLLSALALMAGFSWTGSAGAEEKIVRVWHTETEPQTVAAFNAIARRYEAQNPGIKIELEGLAWAELEGKISAALAAGTPPELSHGQPITCTALQAKGLLLPLDDVADAIGRNNLLPQVQRVCAVKGQLFGLPHAVATSLLIYRKDLAERAGLKAPESWPDLVAAAKALTQDTSGDGKIDIYGVSIPGDNLFINIILGELIKANGGALFDQEGRPLLTDQRMIETLEFFRALTKYAPPGWEGQSYLQSYQNLSGGKTAIMLIGLGRGAGMIERSVPKEMASDNTFAVWTKPHGPSGSVPAVEVDEEPWMLFKNAKYPKEAAAFLKFFYKDENYLQYVSTVPIHLLPVTLSLRQSPQYRNIEMFQRWKSWINMQESYLDKDEAKPVLVTDWADMTGRPYLLDVLNSAILRDMVIQVAVEGEEPKAAAEKAQKRLERLLSVKGYLGASAAQGQ